MITKAQRRFQHLITHGEPKTLNKSHPAVVEGTTLYRARVSDVSEHDNIFKSGMHSRKIGSHVVKGKWKGMPIFTLTLEERATCPRSCLHWFDCYGNKMNWSKRIRYGKELEERIKKELEHLSHEHKNGFVIRLHVLGDFYSYDYTKMWHYLLMCIPQVHIFGYTAHEPWSKIGKRIIMMNSDPRCVIRFSNGGNIVQPKTITIEDEASVDSTTSSWNKLIVCPAQTGKTDCCGTCALCWAAPEKTIAFLRH